MKVHRYINFLYHSTVEVEAEPRMFRAICEFQKEFAKVHTENTFTVLSEDEGYAFSQRYQRKPDGGAWHSHMWKHEKGIRNPDTPSYDDLIKEKASMKVKADKWDIPDELPKEIRMACRKILEVAGTDSVVYTGGCTPFYSAKQWKDRGEEYGTEAELVIVHDGGDFSEYFSYMSEYPKLQDRMNEALNKLGLYAEPCTCWYTAIYKN
jgi:hypothetical protein